MMKLIVAFGSAANAPNNDWKWSISLEKHIESSLTRWTETILNVTRSRRYNERRYINYRGGNRKFIALKVSRQNLRKFANVTNTYSCRFLPDRKHAVSTRKLVTIEGTCFCFLVDTILILLLLYTFTLLYKQTNKIHFLYVFILYKPCRHVCMVCTELQNTVNHELLMMNEMVFRNM